MITVQIDETQREGQKILKQISENPEIGSIKIPGIERDENGRPLGISVDEYCDKLKAAVIKHYEENPQK